MNIAIDGPGGAGKSTAAKLLAQRLGYVYLDTGAMYRAVGLKALRLNIDFSDRQSVEKMLENTKIDIKYEDGVQKVYLDGADVSGLIREHNVSKAASDISALPCVRLKMSDFQRMIAKSADTVLDGRDIGTFVLPDAEFKFFLTASAQVRAHRRYAELRAKGFECNYNGILEDINQRDYNDMNRELAPLKKAADAIEINSDNLDANGVVELMLKYMRTKA